MRYSLFIVMMFLLSPAAFGAVTKSIVTVENSPPEIYYVGTYTYVDGIPVPYDEFTPSNNIVYIAANIVDRNTCDELTETGFKIVEAEFDQMMDFDRFGSAYRGMTLLSCQDSTATYAAIFRMNKHDNYRTDSRKYPGSYRILVLGKDGQSYDESSNQREWADYHYGKSYSHGDGHHSKNKRYKGPSTADQLTGLIDKLEDYRYKEDIEEPTPGVISPEVEPEIEYPATTVSAPKGGSAVAQLGSYWAVILAMALVALLVFQMKRIKGQADWPPAH